MNVSKKIISSAICLSAACAGLAQTPHPATAHKTAAGTTAAANTSGTPTVAGTRAHIGWFGVTVASCERGDVRQSPNGLYVYDANGRREIPVSGGRGTGLLEMREMYECLHDGTPITHDGRWALATLEIGLAISESSDARKEIMLRHQVPVSA